MQQLASVNEVGSKYMPPYFANQSFQVPKLTSIATITTNSNASKLNLVYNNILGDGAMEEIVLRVQGYLVESKLPPLRKNE